MVHFDRFKPCTPRTWIAQLGAEQQRSTTSNPCKPHVLGEQLNIESDDDETPPPRDQQPLIEALPPVAIEAPPARYQSFIPVRNNHYPQRIHRPPDYGGGSSVIQIHASSADKLYNGGLSACRLCMRLIPCMSVSCARVIVVCLPDTCIIVYKCMPRVLKSLSLVSMIVYL